MTEEIGLTAPPHASRPKLKTRSWILKFAIVGGAGTVLNTAALAVLYRGLHMPLMAATALAVELAVVNNYLLNNRWTFAAPSLSLRRFVKFNVSSLGGLAVNILSVLFLTRHGLHFIAADLVGIAAGFAINFALSSTWVWGRTS